MTFNVPLHEVEYRLVYIKLKGVNCLEDGSGSVVVFQNRLIFSLSLSLSLSLFLSLCLFCLRNLVFVTQTTRTKGCSMCTLWLVV